MIRRLGRARTAGGAAALLLLLVGCSPGQADHPAPSRTIRPDPTTTPATTGPTAPTETRVGVDAAKPLRPTRFTVLGTVPLLSHGVNSAVVAVGADGSTLVAQKPATAGDRLEQDRLVLYRGAPDGPATTIRSPAHRHPQQVLGAVVTSRWVIWMETPSNGLDVQPWVMYAYDLRTGHSTQLTASRNVGPNPPPPPPGFTGLTAAGDSVYWAQVGGTPGAETVDVLGCRISACRPVRYAAGAAFPAATEHGLYVITTGRYTGDAKTPVTAMSIRHVDVQTKASTEVASVALQSDQQPGGLAAAGNTVIWIIGGHPSQAVALNLDTRTRTRVDADSEGLFSYPVAGQSFLAWAEASGSSPANVGGYLLDPASGTLSSIGNTAGLYAIHAGGPVLSWQDSASADARPEGVRTTVVRVK